MNETQKKVVTELVEGKLVKSLNCSKYQGKVLLHWHNYIGDVPDSDKHTCIKGLVIDALSRWVAHTDAELTPEDIMPIVYELIIDKVARGSWIFITDESIKTVQDLKAHQDDARVCLGDLQSHGGPKKLVLALQGTSKGKKGRQSITDLDSVWS